MNQIDLQPRAHQCEQEDERDKRKNQANAKAESRKEVDPFTLEEANLVIAQLYKHKHWPSQIYAAFFDFMFFIDLRLTLRRPGITLGYGRYDQKDRSRTTNDCTGGG